MPWLRSLLSEIPRFHSSSASEALVLISLGSLVYGMRYLEWSSTPLQASFLNPEQFSDGNSVNLLLARLWTGLNGTYSGMMSMWFQRAMLIATTSWLKMASCPRSITTLPSHNHI